MTAATGIDRRDGLHLRDMRTASTLSFVVAGTSAVVLVSLILFYALEIRSDGLHVFGPLSDIGTVAWDLLLVPLILGLSRSVLIAPVERLATTVVAALSIIGSISSALLVADVLPFGISTSVSIVTILAQSYWLYLFSRRLRSVEGWSPATVRLGLLIPVGQIIGASVFAGSLLFGWMSTPQLVIMIIGLVPGLVSWAAWPVWFTLLGRDLGAQAAGPEDHPWQAAS